MSMHLLNLNLVPESIQLIFIGKWYSSLGVSVDISLAAVESAKFVIAQVNRNVPRTHGDGFIHISQINAFVYHDEPLSEIPCDINNLEETDRKIGEHVASLIPDRACLQLGVGSLPNAVCAALTNHKDIGIHTELMSDGILELFKKGVITNKYKGLHQHEILCTFVMGTKNIYDFVNDNPQVIFRGADYVNGRWCMISKLMSRLLNLFFKHLNYL